MNCVWNIIRLVSGYEWIILFFKTGSQAKKAEQTRKSNLIFLNRQVGTLDEILVGRV